MKGVSQEATNLSEKILVLHKVHKYVLKFTTQKSSKSKISFVQAKDNERICKNVLMVSQTLQQGQMLAKFHSLLSR